MLTPPEPYSPDWPLRFSRYRAALLDAGAPHDWQIAHIGSTAVPGLLAKPIIDMQITLLSPASLDWEVIRRAGFDPAPEITRDDPVPGWPPDPADWAKSYARRITDGIRTAHLHIRHAGRTNQRLALLVRDHLRADTISAALYADMKRTAAALGAATSEAGGAGSYSDLKDPFVRLLILRAEDWAQRTNWTLPSH